MHPWHLESSFSHTRGGRLGTEVVPASMLNVTLATGTEPCGWAVPSTAVKHYLQTPVRKQDTGTPSPSVTPPEVEGASTMLGQHTDGDMSSVSTKYLGKAAKSMQPRVLSVLS